MWCARCGLGWPEEARRRGAGAGGGDGWRRRRSDSSGRWRPGLGASPARGGACGRVGLVRERAESGAPRRARPAALMARGSGGPAREGRRGWARKLHGNEGVPFPGSVEADVGRRVALRVRQGRGGGAAAMAGRWRARLVAVRRGRGAGTRGEGRQGRAVSVRAEARPATARARPAACERARNGTERRRVPVAARSDGMGGGAH